MKNISSIWKQQKRVEGCRMMACPVYDTYEDFSADPSGFYVLIRVNFEHIRIEVAVCSSAHEIVQIFCGGKAQDLYHTIFAYEKEHNLTWFLAKDHAAYLGKELKKAELALVLGNNAYYQE